MAVTRAGAAAGSAGCLVAVAVGAVLMPFMILGAAGAGAAPVGGAVLCARGGAGQSFGAVRLDAEQMGHASTIVTETAKRQLSEYAAAVAVTAAYTESKLRSSTVHTDHDSEGLFQQRISIYTKAVAADPVRSTNAFLDRLVKTPGWQSNPVGVNAQAVQRSGYPERYQPNAALAAQIVSQFWASAVAQAGPPGSSANPAAAQPLCPAGGTAGTFTGPGGPFPPQACSVIPDPTTGRGCLTPRMLNLATQLQAQGWQVSCWDPHPWNPHSDHPKGAACDVFPGRAGELPSAPQKANGDALAASLRASAARTGVSYLIWYGHIWSVSRDDEEWRPYGGGGIYAPSEVTGGHFDHIHISML
jgi:hypothetical protein